MMVKSGFLTLVFVVISVLVAAQIPKDSSKIHSEVGNVILKESVKDSLSEEYSEKIPKILSSEQIPSRIYYGTDWNNQNTRSTYCFDKTKTYILPLDTDNFVFPCSGKVISNYGVRNGRMHTGIDIKQNYGDSICAAWDGVVRIAKSGYYSYGSIVVIRHENGLETFYAHLSKIKVSVNQKVKAGDLIGLAGRTGRATTEHLHFELRFLYQSMNPKILIDFNTQKPLTDTLVVSEGKFYSVESYKNMDKSLNVPITEDTVAVFSNLPEVKLKDSIEKNTIQKVWHKEPSTSSKKYHIVKPGDTLYAIARRYHTTVKKLCEINKIKEEGILSLGQKIKLR